MRKLYTTKLINRPEMKFYLVIDYTLPSTWLKSTQAEIQNDGGSLGLVISLKTRSRLSHLIKRESLMFSLRQYCLDFPIFIMIDSKFRFSPTFTSNLFFWTRNTNDICMLFAGWEVRMVKSILRPRSQFFTIRTDPMPVNNIFTFFLTWRNSFRKNPNDLGL